MALGRSNGRAPSEPRRGDARLDHEARTGPPPFGAAVGGSLGRVRLSEPRQLTSCECIIGFGRSAAVSLETAG